MDLRRIVAFMVVCGLVLALPAWSQERTGKISGAVIDQAGTGLAGVTVTVASDVLMGGTRVAITGDTGAYRFAALPPGVYTVTASLAGFQTLTTEDVRVNVGATAITDFQMQEQFSEEVTVYGESPLVDVTSSTGGDTFTAEFIKDLPTQRNFFDMMSVSKGVTLATEDSDRLVIGGSNVQSNNWFIDGIETTAPETGTAWVYVNPDAVAEIQVVSIGAPAEYGNMMGGTLNVVTKSGSNEFKGGANIYFFDDSLVDSAINADSQFPEYHQKEFYDITATLGGPIVMDRLWFFAAYEYWRDGHAFPGSDPDTTPTWYSDRYDLKLSMRFTDSHMVDVKGYYDNWGYPDPASEYVEPSGLAGEVGTTQAWGFGYTGVFTDRTFMEARYTGWQSDDDYLSQTGSNEPAFIDYSPEGGGPERYYGGVYWPWTYNTSIDQVSASVSHFADDFIKGSHDFKFGVQASSGDAITAVAPGMTGVYYYRYVYPYYYNGSVYEYEYFYKVEGLPYKYGNEQKSWSAFFDDKWQVTDRLTLNIGVRYDNHRGIIPSFPRLDWDWSETGETIPGVDPVFEWSNFSPRLGLAYALGAENNAVIRASFGVYYDGNVGGNWNSPPPNHPGEIGYISDSIDGPWEYYWDWVPPPISVDPDLKQPRTLQYALTYEHAVSDKYSFEITGIYKDTKDLVGWKRLDDGVYDEVEYTDPFTGNTYTIYDFSEFPTTFKGNDPGWTVNPNVNRGYWQEYWALILGFNRRFTDFWSMNASYTLSESTGLIPRFLSQWQFNPFYGSDEGRDANSYLNAEEQNLQGDRKHMLRVQANFELGKGWHANTLVNFQSGRPYARQTRLPVAGSPLAIMVPASDSQRHPFQYLWDIGLGKRFNIGGSGEVNLGVQVLNVLNNDATDWFETVALYPGDDFVPNWWVKPRRVQLRAGIQF